MERQLPLVDLAGTAFCVDVLAEELRQKDNPGNRISFNHFALTGKGYRILFDKKKKCAVENRDRVSLPDPRYEWVILPALMELDAEGIALKYGIPLSVLRPQQDTTPPEEQETAEGDVP